MEWMLKEWGENMWPICPIVNREIGGRSHYTKLYFFKVLFKSTIQVSL